ncbi:hypothetical protein Lal_00021264 [Lupinus albus]|nr:hypothetical protein Lal_00021264 [Lupinus albus]
MAILGIHNTLALTFGIIVLLTYFLKLTYPPVDNALTYRKHHFVPGVPGSHFPVLPYLVALFSSMLWLYYAYLKTNAILLITINSIGCVIETIYISMYIIYAHKDARSLTIKLLMTINIGVFTLISLISQYALPHSLRVKVVGWICVSVSSVEFMPFWLSFFLTLSAIMWFAYGAFLKDICIAIPNVLGFTLGLLQMLLYAIYRKGEARKNDVIEEREKTLDPMRKNVVEIPLRTHEVILISANDHVNEQGTIGAKGVKEKENSMEINECPV